VPPRAHHDGAGGEEEGDRVGAAGRSAKHAKRVESRAQLSRLTAQGTGASAILWMFGNAPPGEGGQACVVGPCLTSVGEVVREPLPSVMPHPPRPDAGPHHAAAAVWPVPAGVPGN